MADFYIAEIRPFAGVTNRIPAGWHLCDGTLLPISGYETLYSLIGIAFYLIVLFAERLLMPWYHAQRGNQ